MQKFKQLGEYWETQSSVTYFSSATVKGSNNLIVTGSRQNQLQILTLLL
jgi:hypothetical protein